MRLDSRFRRNDVFRGQGGLAINTRPEYIIQPGSPWYNRLDAEIGRQELSLGTRGTKKYRLDLLRRAAKRVDEFSATCGECEAARQEISALVQDIDLSSQVPGRGPSRQYSRALNRMVAHLKKVHKLVDKWYYVGISTGIGTALGAGLGGALGGIFGDDNIGAALGPALGVAIGIAAGAYLENKARREGRFI